MGVGWKWTGIGNFASTEQKMLWSGMHSAAGIPLSVAHIPKILGAFCFFVAGIYIYVIRQGRVLQ